jgi:hypothetical protein
MGTRGIGVNMEYFTIEVTLYKCRKKIWDEWMERSRKCDDEDWIEDLTWLQENSIEVREIGGTYNF